jgi:hypothetical protein
VTNLDVSPDGLTVLIGTRGGSIGTINVRNHK